MSVIVLTWDNTDPEVYGPYGSEGEARSALETAQAGWGDRDWDSSTGALVLPLRAASD